MSWLDDILFAPIKWALPEEIEKKLNPVFDAVGAAGNVAIGKWDSAAVDVVKIAKDSCELAGAKDATKALGKVAEGVDLIGGGILTAGDRALEASANAAMSGIANETSKKAADAALSKSLETVAVRAGTAVAAGAAGAVATREAGKFIDYAKTGDALVSGNAGLVTKDQIAARVFMTATGGAVGGALGKREGAEAGLNVGLGIGGSLGDEKCVRAVTQALGTSAGIAVGNQLAVRDNLGNRRFNMNAFASVNGAAASTVALAESVALGDARATVESLAAITRNSLSIDAEKERAQKGCASTTLLKVLRATDGMERAASGVKTLPLGLDDSDRIA
ncbi:MAG: hypothetical protein HYY84_16270 [Deltaproteobacteria bacterium]|nr:hypothetical protein [Deltaproteobacteria bacterium]